ncbi:MAG: efflux RND transporter permease subunit [Planctomycetota bacterium]|jgi:predicted RND superfamily exporter protein
MTKHQLATAFFFDRMVLRYPKAIILCLLIVVTFLGYQARHFRLDASADTLVLENDESLRYARVISSRYGQRRFLILTYTPTDDLFSPDTLSTLGRLRDDLLSLEDVDSVLSILDVPLLESPPVSIKELTDDLPTLESPAADREMARIELRQSPLYQNLLISSDLKTTALLVYLSYDNVYRAMLEQRKELQQKKISGSLTPTERFELKGLIKQCRLRKDRLRTKRHQDIIAIRAIMDKYRPDAELFLGGVGMIADDMITFIKKDLKVFGLGVLLFLILMLFIIFRRKRWIFLPILCCLVSVVCMIGLLGWFGWEVTVISSNFISLQLIITLAIVIHLIVRFRELLVQNPQAPTRQLIFDTVRFKLKPCVYAVLTTIAGFASLVLCEILPVITFGWMMIAGLIVSLTVTFLLFPAVLILMPRVKLHGKQEWRFSLTSILARFTARRGAMIVVISGLLLVGSLVGISRLDVENCFIDYFHKTTEIYRGMKVIDQQLGGTTPLDIVIDFEQTDTQVTPDETVATESEDASDEFDEFDEFDEYDEAATDEKYWFNSAKMERVKTVHNYLDSLPESGKVLSLATLLEITEKLNSGKPLDSLELALLYSETPDEFKTILLKPYVSVEHNQVRFWVRVRDSEKSLKRNELLKKIEKDLTGMMELNEENIHLSGMLVLYNNMLQSLFDSQILTLGITVLLLTGMFLVLFRSLKIALIALLPNVLSVAVVLGVMGWLNIPLDMMTITIAAISIGIAVDDTIHYIHRFKDEFDKDRSYINTMHRCHRSIGHAMYYTSVTIIIGFSILAMSNFIPSVYFGLLTGLAMLIALLGALTLLPQMLILVKPFGKELENPDR